MSVQTQWWLARLGQHVAWARLRIKDAGTAEVFDCDGRTVPYEDEHSARAALMDADYLAFDGLDDEDAAALGFALGAIAPPAAEDEEALRGLMIQTLPGKQ